MNAKQDKLRSTYNNRNKKMLQKVLRAQTTIYQTHNERISV